MSKTLAVKYRPQTWDDVVEQDEIKIILQNQLATNELNHAYLFVGGAGTGKTTCARILANEINKHNGAPIEIDGASNNGVDQVRKICDDALTRSVDSEYKIFIIDECHMLTTAAWNAMLKTIEEPPLKTIFIFCTTNPEKIPKTILSRVQRFDFKRISLIGIQNRLTKICNEEDIKADTDAIKHIAKLANGHMRDAITMLDKVKLYSDEITEQSVTDNLGVNSYYDLGMLFNGVTENNEEMVIRVIENSHKSGRDLRDLIDDEISLVIDYLKWSICKESFEYCTCPYFVEEWFSTYTKNYDKVKHFLRCLLRIKDSVKYSDNPKDIIESLLILECEE